MRTPRVALPPSDLEGMLDLGDFLNTVNGPAALVGPDGQTVALPREAFEVLRQVAEAMRDGKAITVAPIDQALTTQEAANYLGISRPTLIKLLDAGEIAYERTPSGRHRRIRLQEVIHYQHRARAHRRDALDELTREAVDEGLYDTRSEDYRDALEQARRRSDHASPNGEV